MKDWGEASTTTPFQLKWIPDVHSWIQNSVEMIYWSGQTFVEKGFTLTNFRSHLNSKRILPYARVDKNENVLCYAEIVKTQNLGFLNLCRVIVRPDLRGKGLGKTFCKSLIDQAILMNRYRSIRLNVLECNQPAISCYQSLGFKISQRSPHARQIKNETYNVVVMTKSLEIK